jgi:hypothetical protein
MEDKDFQIRFGFVIFAVQFGVRKIIGTELGLD